MSTSTSANVPATTYPSIIIRDAATLNPSILPKHYEFLKAPLSQKYRIRFRHPAYPANDNILFTLFAWDHTDGGIHHGLAHCACAIIADNRFDGYLSTAAHGEFGRIDAKWDDVLPAKESDYYFHVPRSLIQLQSDNSTRPSSSALRTPYRWPIVPSFQDWSFPSEVHEVFTRCSRLREATTNIAAQSHLSAAVHQRDVSCRVTSFQSSTQVAHVIPEHERAWFLSNNMSVWNNDTTLDPDNLLRDLSNRVLLRSDIHIAFDDRKFVFFPKGPNGFVTHMLEPTPDIGQLYHNRPIGIPGCGIEFLFARFAWSIFPFLSGFISKPGASRLVVQLDSRTGERVIEEVADSVRLAARAKASRSNSPTKRAKGAADPQDIEEEHTQLKRRRTRGNGSFISSFSSTPPALDAQYTDDGQSTALTPYLDSMSDHPCRNESIPPAPVRPCEHITSLEVLKREALERQRPQGFVAQRPPYKRDRPAREELEIMGVEILGASDEDNFSYERFDDDTRDSQ